MRGRKRDHLPATGQPSRRRVVAGQALIIFALFSLVLLGALALAVDAGMLLAERRQDQAAADAAALAAGRAAVDVKSATEVLATGQLYGAQNSRAGSTITINRPPTSGPYAGNNKYVEAVVTSSPPKFFVGAVYTGAWTVTARAVAGIEPVKRPYALLALHPPGIAINGGPTIRISGAGSIMSNGNITNTGGSSIVTVGGTIDANGTIQSNSLWVAPGGIRPGEPMVNDPLAGTPPPPKGATQTAPDCKSDCTFSPGYYNNLGTINIAATATFQPGTYYFDGNTSLNLQNTTSLVKGSGVMFYFTGSSSFLPKNGGVDLSANTTTALYPGGVTGLLFWIANCSTFDSQGNGIFKVEGVIYAPCSHVELHGTPGSNGLQVIVGDLVLKGTSDFNINYRQYVVMDVPEVWLVE